MNVDDIEILYFLCQLRILDIGSSTYYDKHDKPHIINLNYYDTYIPRLVITNSTYYNIYLKTYHNKLLNLTCVHRLDIVYSSYYDRSTNTYHNKFN